MTLTIDQINAAMETLSAAKEALDSQATDAPVVAKEEKVAKKATLDWKFSLDLPARWEKGTDSYLVVSLDPEERGDPIARVYIPRDALEEAFPWVDDFKKKPMTGLNSATKIRINISIADVC